MAVADIAGIAIAVEVDSPVVVVGVAKYVVAVKAEAAPMVPPLISHAL